MQLISKIEKYCTIGIYLHIEDNNSYARLGFAFKLEMKILCRYDYSDILHSDNRKLIKFSRWIFKLESKTLHLYSKYKNIYEKNKVGVFYLNKYFTEMFFDVFLSERFNISAFLFIYKIKRLQTTIIYRNTSFFLFFKGNIY